jgi:hypothetical protein
MNFDRSLDIKPRIGIGIFTERSISKALQKREAYKEYILSDRASGPSHRAEWIHPKDGSYVYLIKSDRNNFQCHPKFPGYYITYDDGGFSYGNLALNEFFKDLEIKL